MTAWKAGTNFTLFVNDTTPLFVNDTLPLLLDQTVTWTSASNDTQNARWIRMSVVTDAQLAADFAHAVDDQYPWVVDDVLPYVVNDSHFTEQP